MKFIMLSITFFMTVIMCQAQLYPVEQGVVPLENYKSYGETVDQFPNGTYFKDVNGVLDKYLGTWTGIYDNKDFKFVITKKIKVNSLPSDSDYVIYFDELRIHYKITDGSGAVLANTLGLPDNDIDVISGSRFVDNEGRFYKAFYSGEQGSCGDLGVLFLKMSDTGNTQFNVYIVPSEVYPKDCPNGYIAPPFPLYNETPMVFTKQ